MNTDARPFPKRLWAFVRLGRPLFLLGGFVNYGLGAAAAAATGHPSSPLVYVVGQIAVTAAQWMTHYSNDYFDLGADRLNETPTRWTGGSRVLPDGLIEPQVALHTALVMMAITLAAATGLLVLGSWLAAGIVLLGTASAWEYTAPPLRLNASGFGEIAAALTAMGLTVLVGYTAQTGGVGALPLLLIVPLCLIQFAMLLTVAFPDATGDAAAGKGTLVVRMGGQRAATLHNAALIAAYLSLPVLVLLGLPRRVGLAMALGAPVAAWQVVRVARGAWDDPNRQQNVAFIGIVLVVGTAGLALAALIVPLIAPLIAPVLF